MNIYKAGITKITSVAFSQRILMTNQVAFFLTISAFIFFITLFIFEYYLIAIASFVDFVLFGLVIYSNYKGFFNLSRNALLIIGNASLLLFSFLFGIYSEVHHICYVAVIFPFCFFKLSQKRFVFPYMLAPICTYFIVLYFKPAGFLEINSMVFSVIFVCLKILNFIFIILSLINIFENQQNVYILKKQTSEKMFLVAEIQHRVRNNLQYILGLIRTIQQVDSKNNYSEVTDRIMPLCLSYDATNRVADENVFDLALYIELLWSKQFKYHPNCSSIDFKLISEKIFIKNQASASLALLINELFLFVISQTKQLSKLEFMIKQSADLSIMVSCEVNINLNSELIGDDGSVLSVLLSDLETNIQFNQPNIIFFQLPADIILQPSKHIVDDEVDSLLSFNPS